jgi:leucyl/phenylalanyl-tRNA--protein transferase
MTDPPLTADLLLRAYAAGVFPMAEGRHSDEIFWVDPRRRGILPLRNFHISRSLRRSLRRDDYTVTTDRAFDAVVAGCADRPETWINDEIARLYSELHAAGFAHSLEIHAGGGLVGGIYGVALGGAFFGESMFSRRRDASKLALAYLVDRLRQGGFRLFDTQFVTDHLRSLGAVEVSRDAYRHMLAAALRSRADFAAPGPPPAAHELLQRSTQMS